MHKIFFFALKKGFLPLLLLLLISFEGKSQYTYTGLRLSYYTVKFDKGEGLDDLTRLNNFALNFDIIHRPLRNIGIGVTVRTPLRQKFKYYYAPDENSFYYNSISGGYLGEPLEQNFATGTFRYEIMNPISYAFFARLYFDVEYNIFLDLRYSFETFEESFSYIRTNSTNLPTMNIDDSYKNITKGLGFSIGYQPPISKGFYYTLLITLDFLGTNATSFNYKIAGDYEYDTNKLMYKNFKSKINDKQTTIEYSCGIGYAF